METTVERQISMIKQAVDRVYNIDIADKTRKDPYPEARSTFYAIVRKMFPALSVEKIGRYTNTHHATVLHGMRVRENTYMLSECFIDREYTIRELIEQYMGNDKGVIEEEIEMLRLRIKDLERKLL